MKIQKLRLPEGWYSSNEQEIENLYGKKSVDLPKNIHAALVAHAGWYFCGELIYSAVKSFDKSISTLIITGGHLSSGAQSIISIPDKYETLSKQVNCNKKLALDISTLSSVDIVDYVDNSVEVVIPMIGYLRPDLSLVTMQIAPNENYLEIESVISKNNNGDIGLLATSDLTHWGPNYGFMPKDSIANPVEWAEKSDKKIMDMVEKLKDKNVLQMANSDHNSCCGGSIANLTIFCKRNNLKLAYRDYSNSYYKHPANSFVGYPLMLYSS